jgi:hypothetical protein
VNRPDARAGQHRHGHLRDHRKVDRHAVALLHAVLFEHVGKTRDAREQLAVGDVLRVLLARVVGLEDQGRLIAVPVLDVAVHAVVADIRRAAFVPADVQVVGLKGDVAHRVVVREPVDALGLLGPEGLALLH